MGLEWPTPYSKETSLSWYSVHMVVEMDDVTAVISRRKASRITRVGEGDSPASLRQTPHFLGQFAPPAVLLVVSPNPSLPKKRRRVMHLPTRIPAPRAP